MPSIYTSCREGTLTLSVPLDSSEQARDEARTMASKCIGPGKTIRCSERYCPDADVFVISVDRDSELGKVLWASP